MKQALLKYYLIVLIFGCSLKVTPQLLFHQENIRGGISVDGKSYVGLDYTQADTITFKNIVPTGAIIKKAYLLFIRYHYVLGSAIFKDSPINLSFNSAIVRLDSSNIVTNGYMNGPFNGIQNSEVEFIVKDVTTITLNSNNLLITPDQGALMVADSSRKLVYNQPCLIILYEDVGLPLVNMVILLNNTYNYNPNIYYLNSLNPINNSLNVGLSLWTSNTRNRLNFQIDAGIGTFSLGDIFQCNPMFNCSTSSQGSFFYENNTLFPLDDDNQDAIFDSTDAIANIQSYLPNSISSFNLTSNSSGNYSAVNNTLGFLLAYTTPCSSTFSKDTSITICKGQSIQLNATTGFTNYNWYPLAGLNDSTIVNPLATPQLSTNYIAYVKDAAGCMHTEHAQLIVHGVPVPDSIKITNAVCATNLGSLLITPNYHNYQPYTYNIGSGATTDTSITNINPGSYTLTVTDNAGCMFQADFEIDEIIPVNASITALPTSGTQPLSVGFFNNSSGANNYNWHFPTSIATSTNANYTFTEAGTYTVVLVSYKNNLSCSDTATVVIQVLPKDTSGIFIPNVFSPNGDGVNDVFEVSTSLDLTIEAFEIYDRWGIQIVNSDNLKLKSLNVVSWDGRTTSGMECSEGTYFYVIETVDKNGKSKTYKGFLSLMR